MPGVDFAGGDIGNYTLGRGIVYFQGEFPTLASGKGWRDMGNATAFNVAIETETKEHQSSLAGLKTTDLEVALSQKMSLTFTLDELNFNNLALFFLGDIEGSVQTGTEMLNAAAADSDDINAWGAGLGPVTAGNENCLFTSVPVQLWLDLTLLFNPALGFGERRAYNFDSTQTIIVRKNATGRDETTGTGLVENTDYILDRKMGRIKIIANAHANSSILVSWTAPAVSRGAGPMGSDAFLERVKMQSKSGIKGKLKFIQENPANGDHPTEYEFHQVTLKPDGDFSMIGDDWTTMSFTAVCEPITTSPYGGSRFGDAVTRRAMVS